MRVEEEGAEEIAVEAARQDEDHVEQLGRVLPRTRLTTSDKAQLAPMLFASKRGTGSGGSESVKRPTEGFILEDGLSREQYHKKKRRRNRKARKAERDEPYNPTRLHPNVKPRAWEKFTEAVRRADEATRADRRALDAGAVPAALPTAMGQLAVASTAHVGAYLPTTEEDRATVRLEDLPSLNIKVVPWNGRWVQYGDSRGKRRAHTTVRDTRPIVTQQGFVPAVAAGRPMCQEYDRCVEDMSELCEEIRAVYAQDPQAKPNRRGRYDSVSIGVSFGGGQTVSISVAAPITPSKPKPVEQVVKNLSHAPENADVVDAILNSRTVHRIANFGSCEWQSVSL